MQKLQIKSGKKKNVVRMRSEYTCMDYNMVCVCVCRTIFVGNICDGKLLFCDWISVGE